MHRRARPGRARDERGSGLIDLVWTTIVLLVPLVYVLLTVFAAQRGALATTAAARAAGRAYVLAPSDAAGQARADAAAQAALADQGVAGADGVHVGITCTPYPHACHQGGSVVTVVVSTRIALPLLPPILGHAAPSISLDATDRLPVGQFHEVTAGAG